MRIPGIRQTSFRSQIATTFGVVVLVQIAVLSATLGNLQATTIRENAGNALQVVANNAQRVLTLGIQRRMMIVQSLADSPTLWKNGLASNEVASALAQEHLVGSNLAWMGVADAKGIVLSATGNMLLGASVTARPWFSEGMRHTYVGDVHDALLLAKLLPPSSTGEPQRFVDFAAPIRIDGRVAGVLAMHGSWDWTRNVIESQLPEESHSLAMDLFILNRAGTVIYAPPVARDGTGIKLGESFIAVTGDAHQNASIVRWPDGRDYLTSVAPLKAREAASDLGWLIVARMPKDVAYAPVWSAIAHVAMFGTIAAVLAMALAWLVAGSISKPLSSIERAAQDVLDGKAGATIPRCDSNAEVERLSNVLIGMTEGFETRVRETTRLARFDPMTKLLNRRGFEEQLDTTVATARRRQSALSVIAIDIDHFKLVNDRHGHEIGDLVLITLAAIMKAWFRETDFIARMGGEEFTVLLTDTDLPTAHQLADRLVQHVASSPFPHVGSITISCGVSKLFGPEEGMTALRRADRALYRAKSDGRNRTVMMAEEMEA